MKDDAIIVLDPVNRNVIDNGLKKRREKTCDAYSTLYREDEER